MKVQFLILSILMMAGISCTQQTVKDIPSNWGTVYYIKVINDYGIVMDNGRKLYPVNLDIKFQVDTLPVLFDYVPVEQGTKPLWGEAVKVTRMQME